MSVFKMIKNGRCTCGAGGGSEACKCVRDDRYTFTFRFGGKPYTRRTPFTKKTKAEKLEKAYREGLNSKRGAEILEFLQSDKSRMRRVSASIAEVGTAYKTLATWVKPNVRRANWNRLLQCCAWAWDLWVVNEGGRSGIKVGAEVPDVDRIGRLSVSRINCEAFVESYFLHRQQEAGLAESHMFLGKAPEHATWTSILKQGLDVFSELSLKRAFKGMSVPDMKLARTADRPECGERLPEPFSGVQFGKLCHHFDSFRDSEPDLWLMNVIHRQTGLRPLYVMALRGDWLVEGAPGKWSIGISDRAEEGFDKKEGTLNQFIPITTELKELITAKGSGLTTLPNGTVTARKLLQKRHNLELKTVLGEVGSHSQGSYRYRDTVASALAFVLGIDAAQWALGHTTNSTTLKHYVRALPGVSELMQAELSAWMEARKR